MSVTDNQTVSAWQQAPELDPATLVAGQPQRCTVAGEHIAVFRTDDGTVYAVDDQCPHQGYPLSKGQVQDKTLTCCWHNFQFDLTDGHCIKGDEAVRTYRVREQGGRLHLDMTPPDPADAIARRYRSLEAGLLEGRMGQVARDVARLQKLGQPTSALLHFVVKFDADRAQWGTTHVLPVAAEALAINDKYSGQDAFLALLQPFALAAVDLVRRPLRSRGQATSTATEAQVLEAIADADALQAEALFRSVLAAGLSASAARQLLYRACAAHFQDIGHHLIYVNKAFVLLDVWGWESADDILPALVVRLANGTRHDTLPKWRWLAPYLTAPTAADTATKHLQQRDLKVVSHFAALIENDTRDAVAKAFTNALNTGVHPADLVDAIGLGAAQRVLRFDTEIDASSEHEDGWLDVTHAFTYAEAIGAALPRLNPAELRRLLLFGLAYVLMLRALDGDQSIVAPSLTQYEAEQAALKHPWTRPIITAHLLKMTAAAATLTERTGSASCWQALQRFFAAPLTQRFLPRQAHEAWRLVFEGKVPKTRL